MQQTQPILIPPYLKPGDQIAIVATARKISVEEIQPAIAEIEQRGFKVVTGNTIGAEDRQFAGDDKLRAADLQQFLDDEVTKAIFCARGGYGSVRLVDHLDFTAFKQHPKWIAGYSDITVLHSHIVKNFGVATLHSTMPINFVGNTADSLNSLFDALTGSLKGYKVDSHRLNNSGQTSGRLVGGNLSILYSIGGSVSDIDTAGKILFIEDLDEYLYHIDRMLMQLNRSGKLSGLAGLVVGGMTDMNDNTIPYGKTAEEIIKEHIDPYNIPLAFGFPAGHVSDNRALYLGRDIQFSVSAESTEIKFL